MPLKLITAATELAVSLGEFKEHLKITWDAEDSDLKMKLATACTILEGQTQTARAFVKSTWSLYLDRWPCECEIRMPLGRLRSVAWIKYTESAGGSPITWPDTEYEVDTVSDPGRVAPAYGKTWPSAALKRTNAIEIQFEAGWDDAPAVPFPLRAAVLLEAGHLYRNRESVTTSRVELQSVPLARGVDHLIDRYKVRGTAL